ncbi:LamG domain-containing protein [Paenibacillus whitsoniae]|uniref:LamG domain-containing protein n=2 Tax=Paenibacillus whitsoniae TaxID=2496558 RepID=A0A3S0CDK5_9BACL|nr:LamG domain-containing protein [Paenibacillus whitsoniae]
MGSWACDSGEKRNREVERQMTRYNRSWKYARFIVAAAVTAACCYVMAGNGERANAAGEEPPVVIVSPVQTMVTNTGAEVALQAPSGSWIDIVEGETVLAQGSANGNAIVVLPLPHLSKGIHPLTAKVTVGTETSDLQLPPVVVYDSDTLTVKDVAELSSAIADHAIDLNGNGSFSLQEEVGYLLSQIPPATLTVPIDDFRAVPTATSATYAAFVFSKPVGAADVKLLMKEASEDSFREASSANASASETTFTITGLTPNTSYGFKLQVTGGQQAGDSNVVSLTTPAEVPPVNVAEPHHAMAFNGAGEYVEIAHDNGLNSPSFTIEAWVKPAAFAWKTGIVSKYQASGQESFTLRLSDGWPIYPDYNKINFQIGDDKELNSVTNLTLNTWYHIAARYDNNTHTMQLYINGVLDSQASGLYYTAYETNTSPLSIGADFLSAPRYFNGQIGEVRFWSTARTAAEIQADMYNHSLSESHPDLAGYWTFDQGASDVSGHGRNGTVFGNP